MEFDTNHWAEWVSDHKRALTGFANEAIYAYLRDGERFRATGGPRVLQILYMPSFEPVISYEIFQLMMLTDEGQSFEYHLLRTIWDTDEDMKKFGAGLTEEEKDNHEPFLSYANASISNVAVDSIFSQLQQNMPIWFYPHVESHYMGLDGTSYELALGGFFLGVRYRWWSSRPEGWQPIYSIVEQTTRLFEEILG